MGKYEEQITANAKAIQDIYDDSKEIRELDQLTGQPQDDDSIAIHVLGSDETLKASLLQLGAYFLQNIDLDVTGFGNVDGGTPSTIYTVPQVIEGGTP